MLVMGNHCLPLIKNSLTTNQRQTNSHLIIKLMLSCNMLQLVHMLIIGYFIIIISYGNLNGHNRDV